MALGHAVNKSTLFEVMAWYRDAASHHLSLCWLRCMLLYGETKPRWVKYRHSCLIVLHVPTNNTWHSRCCRPIYCHSARYNRTIFSIPAVRYDLSGGLTTYHSSWIRDIWLFVYSWTLCNPDMVFIYVLLKNFSLCLSISHKTCTCFFSFVLKTYWHYLQYASWKMHSVYSAYRQVSNIRRTLVGN